MRYALFHNLPPGGALRSLYDKLVAARRRSHHLTLFSLSSASRGHLPLHQVAQENVVEDVSAYRGPEDLEVYAKACERIAARINDGRFDVVFIDKCRYFGSPAVLRFLRRDHVYYCHEPLRFKEYEALAQNPLASVKRFLSPQVLGRFLRSARPSRVKEHEIILREDRRNIRAAARVMTNSEFTARWIRSAYGVRAAVNYQGVDWNFFRPPAGEVPRRRQVLSVGRLSEAKGCDFVLSVLARIPVEQRPLWVIAVDTYDADYEQRFMRAAQQKGVAVELRTDLQDGQLRKLYQESGLVLCASYNEPFGLVPLEAMSCETPVIAVAEGGYRETVIDGQGGRLLPRNETKWAQAIQDAGASAAFSPQARQQARTRMIQKWSGSQFCQRLEDSFAGGREKG